MSRASIARVGGLALLWGSNFLWIKIAVEGLSPIQVVLARMAIGAAVLVGFARLSGRKLPRGVVIWGHLLVAALVANVIPYFLFAWAEQDIPSNLAGVLNSTTPLFTAIIAYAAGVEARLESRRVTGLLVGFVGALLVLSPWRIVESTGSLTRQLGALTAAASYGVSYAYMRRYLAQRDIEPVVLAAGQMAAATAMLVIAAPFIALTPVDLTLAVVGATLVLGGLGTGAAYVLNYHLIRDEGATTASIVTYLLPVVAVVLGVAVLDEPMTWNLVVGGVLVLFGVALSRRKSDVESGRRSAASTSEEA